MKKLLFTLLALFLSVTGYAETLYVRHGLATGNSDGSDYDNAFRGVDEIVWDADQGGDSGEVGPGDTLFVCGGPYDDILVVGASGTAEHTITLDGDCSGVDPSYSDGTMGRIALQNVGYTTGMNISLYDDEYIIVQNLSFDDIFGVRKKKSVSAKAQNPYGTHDGGIHPTVMTDSGKSWDTGDWAGGVIFNISDSPVSRGVIVSSSANTITVSALTGGTKNQWENGDDYRILDDLGAITVHGVSNNITIRNNTFNLDDTNIGLGIYFQLSMNHVVHDVTIDNNIFSGGDETAIWAHHKIQNPTGRIYNIIVSNNTVTGIYEFFKISWYDQHRLNIDPDGDGSTNDDYAPYGIGIENNTIEIKDRGFNAFSIKGIHEVSGSDYNYIRNNIITTLGTQVSHTNLFQIHWAKDLIIEGNTISGPSLLDGCDGCGIIIDWSHSTGPDKYISDGVIVRNNIVRDASGTCTGKGISVYRGRNIQVYNNLVLNSDYGIKVSSGTLSGYESENVKVYNNTIYNSNRDGILISDAEVPSVKIKNNLIDTSGSDGIDSRSANVDDSDEDFNLIYNSTGTDCRGDYGARTDNTCGASDVQEDPALDSDFRPIQGSPAIDNGTVLPEVTSDLDGNTRPQGSGYDIGAFEYVEPTDQVPPMAPSNLIVR